jgi:hypothetical protein
MAEELPGFIPRILRADDVSLLRADETVFDAMVDGWRAQMQALPRDRHDQGTVPFDRSVRRFRQRVRVLQQGQKVFVALEQ